MSTSFPVGVGERPPRRSERVAHHTAAGGERGRDACLRLFVRHIDGDVDGAAAVRARLIHLLEPLGYVPPAEFEEAYYDRQAAPSSVVVLT